MTIKPQKNQTNEEKLQHSDGTNQNNSENQAPLRNIYDENLRLRRSPHKSLGRSKHKRDHEIQPVIQQPPINQITCSSSNSITTNSIDQISTIKIDEPQISGYNSGDEHTTDSMLTAEQWQKRDDEFSIAIKKCNLRIEEILDDGACLFRAIALQIYGDQEMHDDIRQQTMDYIQINKEYFAQFVTEDITKYILRKRKTTVHGNHIEIQAISEMYNRAVELFSYKTEPINIFRPEQLNNGYEPFRLSYQRSSHYNAIINPFKESIGVGLGLSGCRRDDGSIDRSKLFEAVHLTQQQQHIEQTMLEDKLKKSDWDATNEAIEEQTARFSYLEYCRENLLKKNNKKISSTITSTSQQQIEQDVCCVGNSSTQQDDDGGSSSPTSSSSTNRKRRRKFRPNDERISEMSGENFQIQYNCYQLKRSKYNLKNCKEFDDENSIENSTETNQIKKSTETTTATTIVNSAGPSCENIEPSTSKFKKNNSEDKPVSQFYQSLLESSYTNDGQLSEGEMVRAAILVSRAEYIDNQNISMPEGKSNNDEDDSL